MGQENLAVVCALWGSWPDKDWSEEYVYRLYRGVKRNLSLPHEFICFADNPDRLKGAPFEVRQLKAPVWDGCLPKLYVYSPEAELEGRVLLLDLDNVIVGDLTDIASYDGPICVRAWFKGWDNGIRDPGERPDLIDGDMISFVPGEHTKLIWEKFSSNPEGHADWTGGRERWFLRNTVMPDLWQAVVGSDQIVSYKNHCRNGLTPNARIVSFHGDPRPHTLDHDWIKKNWY